MLTRRNFLKGLLSSVAAAALVKNGVVQPDQIITQPKRTIFDMAQNTWRKSLLGLPGLRGYWPMDDVPVSNWRLENAELPFGDAAAFPYRDAWEWSGRVTFTCADQPALERITRSFIDEEKVSLLIRHGNGQSHILKSRVVGIVRYGDVHTVEFSEPWATADPKAQWGQA